MASIDKLVEVRPAAALCGVIVAGVLLSTSCGQKQPTRAVADVPDDVYANFGVHNDAHADVCTFPNCTYKRGPGEPTDPIYPEYWTSHWNMYRVYNNYEKNPPPYPGKPPAPLVDGVDYQTSAGATYYDSSYSDTDSSGKTRKGAMMEHYEKFCLPIFPIANNYTCSFISLGDTAFFVTYDDRPASMPPVCLFSPRNHAPERDFIKHLPYSKSDGAQLEPKVLGYSFWVSHQDGKPMQVGVSPDQTANMGILFGYAFEAAPTPDRVDKAAAPYQHPQSFYFSGYPMAPANAPIVSQNYTDFAMIRPDPATTWARVSGLKADSLPKCMLFNPPQKDNTRLQGTQAPTWNDIGKRR